MALNREEDRSNSPMDSHRKAQQQYYQRHCALNEARETGLEVAHNLISELESSLAESRRKLRWAEKHQDDVIEERVRDRVLAELEVAEYHHRRAKRQLEYRNHIELKSLSEELERVREELLHEQKMKLELQRALRQLIGNAHDAVELLPRGHQLRPEMRQTLTDGFSHEQVCSWFGPSFSYYYLTHQRMQPPNRDAARFSAEFRLLEQYFEQYPMSSKHTYRVVTCTLEQFYEEYCKFHEQRSPQTRALSYMSVRRYMNLPGFHWRFEKHPLFCPYCDTFRTLEHRVDRSPDEQADFNQAIAHQQLMHQQRDFYYKTLKEIVSTQDATRIVAVQDFSTFFIDKEPIPVLIIVLYMYDPVSPDHLARFYRFVMPSTDRKRKTRMSNNTAFVAAAWDKLFADDFILSNTNWSRLEIFSDGGPKHFKTTAHLHYWCSVKARFGAAVDIRYTFFAPHHGESVCDGAAHHIQTAQHSDESRHGQFENNEDFARLEDPRASRVFFFIEQPAAQYLAKFKSLHGIKSYFALQFIDEHTLRGWYSSAELGRPGIPRVLPA